MASLTTTPSRVLRSPTALSLRFLLGLRLRRRLGSGRPGALRLRRLRLPGGLRRRLSRRGLRRRRRGHRGRLTAPFANDRVSAREVPARESDARRVLGHPHRELEAEVEDFLRELPHLLGHLVLRQLAPLGGLHSVLVRITNLVVIPILLAAVRNASRASDSPTPSIS